LIEMLRSFGATSGQIFRMVSLPSATPFILAGLKLGIGRGLIAVVVAELFGSRAGLGRLISQSADAFNMPELFAGVVVLAAAGIAMTAGFSWLESRLVPWTRARGAARDRALGRTRRVHLAGRPERLRQDHLPAHRRRTRAGERGPRADRR